VISVCEPSLSDLEKKYVHEAIDKNWLSSIAPPVHLFEEAFARRWGAKHAVAVNSGGSALFLALWALGIHEGDEVLMPAFTMIATAGAVTQCGGIPVFVDSEPGTGNIDVSLIEDKITTKTKMIMPVHIYGHPCDMDPIRQLARDYGLLLVEDAAESHGALYRDKQVGTLSNAGCFSFYANKIITSGEGGMILTDDDNLAHRVRHARAYDFDEVRHFWHKRLAWNLRMSALEAAVGRAQLERLDELIEKRQQNAAYYTEHLADLVKPLETKDYATPVSWMYGLLVQDQEERDGLMDHLARNNVETRTFFLPMHQQPVYKSAESFPVAEDLGQRGMYLPSSSHLSKEDKDTVIRHVREYLSPRR